MRYDVIIVGAGLGGLTAGAKLAKEGKKVLLIEQHNQPGGCATSFRRGDFTLEVGLHEMDGPSPDDIKSKIFNELEVSGNIEFIKVPEFYHFIHDKISITIPHESDEAIRILKENFPDETEGIDAFFNQILNSRKKNTVNENERDRSLGEFLDSIIRNEDLKLVLLGNLGYFHDDPFSVSLKYYTMAQGSYYKYGASFIKGSSQKLSDYLAEYINNHGGTVLLNHLVTGLISDDGQLTGVSYKSGKRSSKESFRAYADEIVANTAIPNVAELLPAEAGTKLKNEIRELHPGASLLTIYFGFRNNLKNIGNKHYSTFVFDNSIKTQADIDANNRADFTSRSYKFIDYGQIDSGLALNGKTVGALCCVDYISDWENLPAKEYNSKKEEVAKKFICRLEKIIPGIAAEIEYYEVATSITIKRYTLNPEGAVYGFAQTPGKIAVEPSVIFDNLHFASAWGKTGGGFSGSIYSGYFCASNILRKRRRDRKKMEL